MAWVFYNPNPEGKFVGDCTVRAVAKATEQKWEDAYSGMALQGLIMADMPSGNSVWGAYLKTKGFKRHLLPDTCPDCYTVEQFCKDYPTGTYIVALSGHVLTVSNGDYYDSWDSGKETPIFYYRKD